VLAADTEVLVYRHHDLEPSVVVNKDQAVHFDYHETGESVVG